MTSEQQRILNLRKYLQIALKVEHSTIPPYLCALYSIEEGTNREAASLVQTVVMEEMLHMALVANLLNAVGGEAKVNQRDFIPTYPNSLPHSAGTFTVPLQKFSREAIDVFLQIEKPEDPGSKGQTDGYETIGQFYKAVRAELRCLRKSVFTGDPKLQITPEYYYGGAGKVFEIFDLKTAEAAIDEIVEQGEGAPSAADSMVQPRPAKLPQIGDRDLPLQPIAQQAASGFHSAYLHRDFSGHVEPAHYYRFQELHAERYYQEGDTAGTGPHGPTFPVRWNAVYNMKPNPSAGAYPAASPIRKKLDGFNLCYMRFLDKLQDGFSGRQKALTDAVREMFEMKHRAVELMRIPTGDGDTTVGPSFEYMPNR